MDFVESVDNLGNADILILSFLSINTVVVQLLSHVWLCNPILQHTRLPCPVLSPGVLKNSCPLSQWCHPTISSSVARFSCPQSFPASGSFPMSWLFSSGGQSIGASASVLPMNTGLIYFKIDWFDVLAVQGSLKRLLQHHSLEGINSSMLSLFCHPALTSLHDYWKNHSFDYMNLWWQSDVSAF